MTILHTGHQGEAYYTMQHPCHSISIPDDTLPYQSIPGGKILHPGHQREGRWEHRWHCHQPSHQAIYRCCLNDDMFIIMLMLDWYMCMIYDISLKHDMFETWYWFWWWSWYLMIYGGWNMIYDVCETWYVYDYIGGGGVVGLEWVIAASGLTTF